MPMINKLLQQQFRLSNMLLHLFTISNENSLHSAADLFIETDTDTDNSLSLSPQMPAADTDTDSSADTSGMSVSVSVSVCAHT